MGLLARLFGRELPPRKRPAVVKWQDHPYTEAWAWRFGHMLRTAKEMKRKRERVGRSADYWQGQIDALTVLESYSRGLGIWKDGFIKCVRGRCVVCGADELDPCDPEKHKQ